MRPPASFGAADYLLTLPAPGEKAAELSVFLSRGLFESGSGPGTDRVASAEGVLSVVSHGPSVRARRSPCASGVSAHPLVIRRRRADVFTDDDGRRQRLPDHKLGGYPYLIREHPPLKRRIDSLYADGFFQLLQLDFIVTGDADWEGDWYFGDGLFHLFGRPPFRAAADWRWLWQM